MNIEEKRKQLESLGWFRVHEEKLGSITWLEIWKTSSRHTTGRYALYREDTGEIIREDLLPEEEIMAEKVKERLQIFRKKFLME